MKKSDLKEGEYQRLYEKRAQFENELKGDPNVIGVAFGLKQTAGKYTDRLCYAVIVRKKKSETEIPENQSIPKTYNNLDTDVIELEKAEPYKPQDLTSLPQNADLATELRGGMKIGVESGGAGTMGGVFNWTNPDTNEEVHVLLSNHHVLYDEGSTRGSKVGSPSYSTGSTCCCECCPDLTVATVVAGIFGGSLDCAIAHINLNGATGSGVDLDEDYVQVIADAECCDEVKKYGAVTGLTYGFILLVDYHIETDSGEILRDLYKIQGSEKDRLDRPATWSASGDSGSLVMRYEFASFTPPHVAHGLHAGGVIGSGGVHGYACKLTHVARDLAIRKFTVLSNQKALSQRRPRAINADWKEYKKKLAGSPLGAAYVKAVDDNFDEILHLVNTSAKVTSAWHKNKGPEFISKNSGTAEDTDRPLVKKVGDVSAVQLVDAMKAALLDRGSDKLKSAIQAYGGNAYQFYDCDKVRDAMLTVVLLSLKEKVFEGAKAYFPEIARNGHKNPDIPPIDPFSAPIYKTHKSGGSWPFAWTADFLVKNTKVHGLSSFQISDAKLDKKADTVSFRLTSAQIKTPGDIDISGKVSGIGYAVHPHFVMTFSRITAAARVDLDSKRQPPRISALHLDVTLEGAELQISGLGLLIGAIVNLLKGIILGPVVELVKAKVKEEIERELTSYINYVIAQSWPK